MAQAQVFENKQPVLGINSLGRIGKLTLWHHIGRKYFKEIIVNQGREVGTGLDSVAQAIEKDSTYGLMHKFLYGVKAERIIQIVDEKEGKLLIDGIPVTILREARNPADVPWKKYGVDVVVDCTGKFKDPTVAADHKSGSIRGHLNGGAKVVINSSPFKIKNKALALPDDAVTMIYGINHTSFNPKKHLIVSAASCTTTGLAHMVKPLLENEETSNILTASMSTVHAVTNTQSVLDSVPKAGEKDLRKNRSILDSIILTSTNAAKALAEVIPQVQNIGFMADSIRIPASTMSLIVLNATFQARSQGAATAINTKMLNELYGKAAANNPEKLIRFTMEQNVSADLFGIDAAVIIEGQFNHTRTAFINLDLAHIPNMPAEVANSFPDKVMKVPVVHAKIFGWYDNEYGSYTNRMGDLTVHIHKNIL
ncbi:MAG TPA: glyceraldehyde 3-phosphate dehydrogenase NAD-binding domain-containing protein [Smithella sp.]|mgnify:FL=1|jgi:glyceraldehyde 3-phosphate dehydrogenase|nr:glyceraldehyde-3-phosphate dehydrogenase [Smithella sp.]NMC97118.1 glyceraldehyde-3-phosphate dehydrogenase [Deltaproteobacteria bacterium]OQC52921.1 MAG: Glyceraldehyde-3-phosphate dehydrogenase 1 [Deltaproteobacteria bacterium ADurb.Bin022]HNQ64548.1 glyceraldehyde 3-phosphate dehydrogenase NAD-binding domain-containing protein [Smithella sp.]HOE32300.1 glyceraldehyde 3-phosphate dehydrogenase NAD-binding domain-containing protein [Smithella sp.]